MLDAAFVDDECIVIVARNGKTLDKAIDIMLANVFDAFENAHLEINTLPGKTEALLKYRGKNSSALRERRRGVDGKLYLQVPGRQVAHTNDVGVNTYSQRNIGVVECYEHLGTVMTLSSEGNKNALHRCKTAMSAYVPLANKIIGSELVQMRYKVFFMSSLVMSRLLFAVYITVPRQAELKKYNAVYMRVLRNISGNSWFSAEVEHNDVQIRQLLNLPSIDCWIARARLTYCGRLI